MDPILTVEDVAQLLKIEPFTVRKMFREQRLSGFKIGKAWRIHASELEADILKMKSGIRVHIPEPDLAPATAQPATGNNPAKNLPPPPSMAVTDSSRATGKGNILVFSDPPGAEVHLDGKLQGRATLSIVGVASGLHELRVGSVAAEIHVPAGGEIRVRPDGQWLAVSTRPLRGEPDST